MEFGREWFKRMIPFLEYNCHSCKRKTNCEHIGGIPTCEDCTQHPPSSDNPKCNQCKGIVFVTFTTRCNFEAKKRKGLI